MNKAESLIFHLRAEGISNASLSILEDAIQQVFINEVIVRSLAEACDIDPLQEGGDLSNMQLELDDETQAILETQSKKLMQEVL